VWSGILALLTHAIFEQQSIAVNPVARYRECCGLSAVTGLPPQHAGGGGNRTDVAEVAVFMAC